MTRVRIAMAIVIAATLLPAVGVFIQTATVPSLFRVRDDQISAFERRYAPLREELRTEKIVGYLAPPSQVADRTTHLYTTRYALAPIQVLDESDLPLVIADGMTDTQRIPAQLRVRRDFGRGLLLLEQAR